MSLYTATTTIPKTSAVDPVAFDDIESPTLRTGYEYWLALRGRRRFPSRTDIRPRDIAAMLRYVNLVKVEDDDFVFRVVGDDIVLAYGVNLQNRRMSDLVREEPAFGVLVVPLLRKVVATGEPLALRGKAGRDCASVNFTACENLLLPFGPDDDTVDHVLSVSYYQSRPHV
jgi:hypothetical protein